MLYHTHLRHFLQASFKKTWNILGVVALLKLRDFVMCCSGSYLLAYPLIMTVLAVPCSPINKIPFDCNICVNVISSNYI